MHSYNFNILVISDFHYIDKAAQNCPLKERVTTLGPIFLRKALLRLHHYSIKPDLIVMLGDMTNDGKDVNAVEDLKTLIEEVKASEIPFLIVPGNHDVDMDTFAKTLDCSSGLHEIGGYGFYIFHDNIAEGDFTTRPEAALAELKRIAVENPELPLIALQHNPIFPDIDAEYPYMPTNVKEIRNCYQEANVKLSLSGHYHKGQSLTENNSVKYYTVPAICEAPFQFALINLNNSSVEIKQFSLKNEEGCLTDVHCHTQYAYCSEDITAERNIEIASHLGLGKLCLTEHAYHLYLSVEDACAMDGGSAKWQLNLEMAYDALHKRNGRIDEYKTYIGNIKKTYPEVCIGLEVDLLNNGELFLAEDDKNCWDLLLGAIHYIPVSKDSGLSSKEIDKIFLKQNSMLLKHRIDVLAHPFRWYRRSGLPIPTHLFPVMAEMLAEANVAAEINMHTNAPDSDFISMCVEREVKIALGTDSHNLCEVAEMVPHLNVLQRAGITPDMFSNVLYNC